MLLMLPMTRRRPACRARAVLGLARGPARPRPHAHRGTAPAPPTGAPPTDAPSRRG